MRLTDKEISALLDKSAEMRYKYSIKRIADADCLWTVISSDGRYCLIADNGSQMFPIWPFREYTEIYLGRKTVGFDVVSIDLNKFECEMIDVICGNNLPLTVFPISDDDTGKIVDFDTFVKDLSVELENYR